MLRFLRIRNLAVIEAVEVEFEPGFNVLTGETGAGKSILVEAVGLLLGAPRVGRPGAHRRGARRHRGDLRATPTAARAVVRREITQPGPQPLVHRRRARHRGRAARPLRAARRAARAARASGAARPAHTSAAARRVRRSRAIWRRGRRRVGRRADAARAARALAHGRPREGRAPGSDRVPARRNREGGAEAGEDESSAPRGRCWRAPSACSGSARKATRRSTRATAPCSRRSAASGSGSASWPRSTRSSRRTSRRATASSRSSRTWRSSCAATRDSVDASPGRLQEVEDRLALLERLKRKYGPTLDDVIDRGAVAGARARAADRSGGARGGSAEGAGRGQRRATSRRRASCRAKRRERGRHVRARASKALLAELAMARTRFEVRFNDGGARPGASGASGASTRPSSRVAEPGRGAAAAGADRLGRRAVAHHAGAEDAGRWRTRRGKTLIFDEVDAGIGGRVADVVGARLRRSAIGFQVLCITHLPQIAARATTHFRIEKHVRGRPDRDVGRAAERQRRGSRRSRG